MEITRRNTLKGRTVLVAGALLLGVLGPQSAFAQEHHHKPQVLINGSSNFSGIDFTMYNDL